MRSRAPSGLPTQSMNLFIVEAPDAHQSRHGGDRAFLRFTIAPEESETARDANGLPNMFSQIGPCGLRDARCFIRCALPSILQILIRGE